MDLTRQNIFLALATCESAVILASAGKLPSHVGKRVLENLVKTGYDASRVRITKLGVLGWVLICAGCMLRIACHKAMGKYFTWELAVKKDHRLVTDGPYVYVRHPAYTAVVLGMVGFSMSGFGAGSWFRECGWLGSTIGGRMIAVWWAYMMIDIPIRLVRRAQKEDKVLRETFGQEWEAWARRTPYVLVPFVY